MKLLYTLIIIFYVSGCIIDTDNDTGAISSSDQTGDSSAGYNEQSKGDNSPTPWSSDQLSSDSEGTQSSSEISEYLPIEDGSIYAIKYHERHFNFDGPADFEVAETEADLDIILQLLGVDSLKTDNYDLAHQNILFLMTTTSSGMCNANSSTFLTNDTVGISVNKRCPTEGELTDDIGMHLFVYVVEDSIDVIVWDKGTRSELIPMASTILEDRELPVFDYTLQSVSYYRLTKETSYDHIPTTAIKDSNDLQVFVDTYSDLFERQEEMYLFRDITNQARAFDVRSLLLYRHSNSDGKFVQVTDAFSRRDSLFVPVSTWCDGECSKEEMSVLVPLIVDNDIDLFFLEINDSLIVPIDMTSQF
ncbi:MAG: hypothetical protein OCD01_09880 [Fibrobacterales bacterium]